MKCYACYEARGPGHESWNNLTIFQKGIQNINTALGPEETRLLALPTFTIRRQLWVHHPSQVELQQLAPQALSFHLLSTTCKECLVLPGSLHETQSQRSSPINVDCLFRAWPGCFGRWNADVVSLLCALMKHGVGLGTCS